MQPWSSSRLKAGGPATGDEWLYVLRGMHLVGLLWILWQMDSQVPEPYVLFKHR